MISGEYRYALDEKGRLMVPAKVRSEVVGNVMILTRGVDRCLWLFPSEEWRQLSENLIAATSPFSERARLIQRRILAPAQEVEIDRSGRIAIPTDVARVRGAEEGLHHPRHGQVPRNLGRTYLHHLPGGERGEVQGGRRGDRRLDNVLMGVGNQ